MKFIPPLEITSKIHTLIEEAKTELILVSPYVKIDNWGKTKSCLNRAIDRNVNITIIARENADQDLNYIKSLKIRLVLIKDLHAKVYISDKQAIVTSQNLLHYSDSNSVEIGYISQTQYERKELVEFVNQYITKLEPEEKKFNRVFSKKEEIIKTIPVKKVRERINYENKKFLKDWQVPKLLEAFRENFRFTEFTPTSSYIFTDKLLPFAHLIIDSHYIIKIPKNLFEAGDLVDKIIILNFNLKLSYKIVVLTSHNSYFYIEFVPNDDFVFNVLVEDYIKITNKILKSDFAKDF
jgi:hypothetical protein